MKIWMVAAAALVCMAMAPQTAMAAGPKLNPNFGYKANGRGTSDILKYGRKHGAGRHAHKGNRRNDRKTAECRRRAHAAGLKGHDAVHPFIVRCKRGKV
jgi:hypothetical protein